jgi:hypothetical protein
MDQRFTRTVRARGERRANRVRRRNFKWFAALQKRRRDGLVIFATSGCKKRPARRFGGLSKWHRK